ncbi:general substrate transporter [Lipomyces kononenkoae]
MVRLLNVYSISAFAALAGVLYGFDVASMSGVLGTQQYKDFFGNPIGVRQGGITGAIAAGSLIGALSSSFLGDWLSRKVAIQLGTILWCVGASLQSASTGIPMLIVGRIVAGICIGLTSSLVPIYQSEIAPRKVRGRVVSLQHFAIALGILIMYFVQYGCSFLDSEAVFRLPWALQTIPAVMLFTGLFWLPRSPRWLASKDRWDEVLQVLAFLRTPNSDINDPLVLAEFKEIEEQVRIEQEESSNSYGELFGKKIRKRLFLGMAIQCLSQLTGVNVLLYFIVYIFQSISISNELFFSSIQYIIFVVATIPTILWTDQWGRRSSLLLGSLGVGFWMFLIAGIFATYGHANPVTNQPYTWIITDNSAASHTIQASVYLASATFALSWGPIEWIYPPEIIPLRVRAKAVSLSTAANWLTNFTLALVMPPLLRSIRWGVFVIFGAFNIAGFIHVWLRVPETKQCTLEEMDEIFEHGEPVWKSFTGQRYSGRLEALAKEIERGKFGVHRADNAVANGICR